MPVEHVGGGNAAVGHDSLWQVFDDSEVISLFAREGTAQAKLLTTVEGEEGYTEWSLSPGVVRKLKQLLHDRQGRTLGKTTRHRDNY